MIEPFSNFSTASYYQFEDQSLESDFPVASVHNQNTNMLCNGAFLLPKFLPPSKASPSRIFKPLYMHNRKDYLQLEMIRGGITFPELQSDYREHMQQLEYYCPQVEALQHNLFGCNQQQDQMHI